MERLYKKILVRMPNWIGDAVMATPTLSALRTRFPESEIALLGKPAICALFEHHPDANRGIVYEDPGRHSGLIGFFRLIDQLQKERFDMAFLLQNAFEAAWIAYRAGIPERAGIASDGRRFLLTRTVEKGGEALHQQDTFFSIMGLFDKKARMDAPHLVVTSTERDAATHLLRGHQIHAFDALIGIHPGAAYGSAKRWDPLRFAAVADELAALHLAALPGATILIFGSSAEVPLAEEIGRAMKQPALILAGKTSVREMMALISLCRLLITNDSGPMHVAAALGVPIVAIFGPTSPGKTSPAGFGQMVQNKVDCSPCYYRECPIDHRCMDSVTHQRVTEAAIRQLARPRYAVFLDRDGTMIYERAYLHSLDQLSLIEGVGRAISRLNRQGVLVFLVTNQSGVARGLFSEDFVRQTHRHLQSLLEKEGAHLNGVYYCPHHPDALCDCRKPKMGMVQSAMKEHGTSLVYSYMVGDKLCDVALAQGGAKGILVKTGYGETSLREMEACGKPPDAVADDLAVAVDWILEDIKTRERTLVGTTQTAIRRPRIAIVKLGSIGDCIHLLPLVNAVRKNIPDAYLAWIVEEKSKEIPMGCEGVNEVIVIDTHLWRKLIKTGRFYMACKAIRSAVGRIQETPFDIAIDGQGLMKSGFVTLCTQAPVRIGFSASFCREPLNTLFTTRKITPKTGIHVIEKNMFLMNGLGIDDKTISFGFSPSAVAVDRVDCWLKQMNIGQGVPIVAMHPGAGFTTKQWPLASFSALADRLAEDEVCVVITTQEGLVQGRNFVLAPPWSLHELAAFYKRCGALVAGDTGPLHLAAAVGTPTVGLFGPSEASRSAPLGRKHRVVQGNCACRGNSSYFPRRCRKEISCMTEIPVEEVSDKVKEILEEAPCPLIKNC